MTSPIKARVPFQPQLLASITAVEGAAAYAPHRVQGMLNGRTPQQFWKIHAPIQHVESMPPGWPYRQPGGV